MKRFPSWAWAVVLFLGTGTAAYLAGLVTAQNRLITPDEINNVEVVRKSLPAVARVDVRLRKDVLQAGETPLETGTGFFVKKDLLVTNYHVVQDSESLSVVLSNGQRLNAKVEGVDPGIDIALLRISGVSTTKTLGFGSSRDLAIGQKIVVIGSPMGISNYVSTGVFSTFASPKALPRVDGLAQEVGQYIMTSASIQSGNSGGPLLDSRGAVIAVADANASPNSISPGLIGVAIPGELVQQSIEDLSRYGVSQRGTLGITMQDLEDLDPVTRQLAGLTSSEGAMVDSVPAGSAGARAALRGSVRNSKEQLVNIGDVVVAVDGQRVRNTYDVTRLVAAKRPGQVVTVRVWRNKQPVDVKVTLLRRTVN